MSRTRGRKAERRQKRQGPACSRAVPVVTHIRHEALVSRLRLLQKPV